MSYPKLTEAVRSVLKTKARQGQTTKSDTTMLVLKRIDNAGGPTKYGIGAAAMRMALSHIVSTEVMRQFKQGLSEHAKEFVLPPAAPAELRQTLGKIPSWIAIEEGHDALWMFALKASRQHWEANARLKEKKAKQTIDRANVSMDVARFLSAHGFRSLEDLLGGGDEWKETA
jgi:rhodanese-related sulfurtransferase